MARRKLAVLCTLATLPIAGLAVPASAAPPIPRVTSPTAGQTLAGTVSLAATGSCVSVSNP